jgi:hypothetical protein
MVDIVRLGSDTPSGTAHQKWEVIRNRKYEILVREYLEEMGNVVSEKDVNSTFQNISDLLSNLPNPNDWGSHSSVKENNYCTALLYGKVQSGKTLASCALSSLALDNGYKTIIVLTSNSNLLREQTKEDYAAYLNDIHLLPELKEGNFEKIFNDYCEIGESQNLVMVLKKEPTILKNVVELFESGHRSKFPTMIIDDEGDQASMNISKKYESTIHEKIRDLREKLEKECLISVTATPYANFRLDPEKERHLFPTIFKTLIPGDSYCGYETFFRGDLTKHWVSLEQEFDYDAGNESFVLALEKAIAYHLVSATIRQIDQNFGPHTMLVNSSTETKDHQSLLEYIDGEILERWRTAIDNESDWLELKSNYLNSEISSILENNKIDISLIHNKFDQEFKRIIKKSWCKVQVINVDNPEPPNFTSANRKRITSLILIGSRSLSRGLRVKGLVTTFFTYSPNKSNMDTYHQMCRFFGYRNKILNYMRIYAPQNVFERWLHISFFDEEMFNEVSDGHANLSPVFVVRPDLKPSRFITSATNNNFQDVSNTGVFQKHIPTDKNIIEQRQVIVDEMVSKLELKSIKSASRRTRYQSIESLDLGTLLRLLELDALKSEKFFYDNWHPKILTNVIKSVYMRPPYNMEEFDIFFLTNPHSDESVKRSSAYYEGHGHFIDRYDEGSDRGMYKSNSIGKIALVFLKVKPTSLDSQVWVPMIYLPELDQQYRGGF